MHEREPRGIVFFNCMELAGGTPELPVSQSVSRQDSSGDKPELPVSRGAFCLSALAPAMGQCVLIGVLGSV